MPKVELIDKRVEFLETRKQNTFSRRLVEAMQDRLDRGEQVILLHNRRGFSSFAACRACGFKMECVNCAITLTFHRRDKRMLWHCCGYAEKGPSPRPKGDSEHLGVIAIG